MNNTIILIPSRMSASRLPGKPLLKINGISIIQHVYNKAKATNLGKVYVANEDYQIQTKIKKNIAAIEASAKTIPAPIIVSSLVGQVILNVSCFTSWKNFNGFLIFLLKFGRSGGTRTHNLRFWRPALYQLNYAPKRLFNNFSYYSSSYCFSTFSNRKI